MKRLLQKSEFARNVLTLMTGTMIAQAIPIAISPILTRLYTPEDFGLYALFISITSLVATVVTARYELAIMLPKKEADAALLVFFSISIAVVLSVIFFVIVFFFNDVIARMLGNPRLGIWLYFAPFSVLLTGVFQSLSYWFNRNKQYKNIATGRVIQNGSMGAANLSMGTMRFSTAGLIGGQLIGQVLATAYIMIKAQSQLKEWLQSISKIRLMVLAKKYVKFPQYNLPNALIDGIRLSGINFLIAKFFSTSILGQFSLAWRMVQFPMALVGVALSQVFFQKISSTQPEKIYTLVKKFIVVALLVAAPFFLILYFFAEQIFLIVFGEGWSIAGKAVSAMTPWLFLNFVTSPLSNIFLVVNRQGVLLGFAILYMLTPLYILFMFNDMQFLAILNIISLAMCALLFLFIAIVIFVTKGLASK